MGKCGSKAMHKVENIPLSSSLGELLKNWEENENTKGLDNLKWLGIVLKSGVKDQCEGNPSIGRDMGQRRDSSLQP